MNEPFDQQRAIGVIERADGQVLFERRITSKALSGLWKLPGGKIEADEEAREALVREMREELGIHATQIRPWITRNLDYPQGRFRLRVFRITEWQGNLQPREGQDLAWQEPQHLTLDPVLPAHLSLLNALGLPPVYAISQASKLGDELFLERLLLALKNGIRLIQIREKTKSIKELRNFSQRVLEYARPYGAQVLINGDTELARELGAAGVHLQPEQYRSLGNPPADLLWAASCHNREELLQAARLGATFAVLSPVLPTRTHPGAKVLGWQGFKEAVKDLPMPVYALGGINKSLLSSAQYHHAQGIAMLSGIW